MDELLPCPFCNGKAKFHIHDVDGNEYGIVECIQCGARLERADFAVLNPEKSVKQDWNKRNNKEWGEI
jgi:Zn ribbon nucleic-acid-binding protein